MNNDASRSQKTSRGGRHAPERLSPGRALLVWILAGIAGWAIVLGGLALIL